MDYVLTRKGRVYVENGVLDLTSKNIEKLERVVNLFNYKLSPLKILILNNNSIKDLPEKFAILENLEELYVKNNLLSFLPESLGKLSHLRVLDLSHNDLVMYSGTIGDLTSLERLDLSNNRLSFIHDGISELESLQILNLRNNRIQYVPESLSELKKLRALDLRENEFFLFPESISKLIKRNVTIQTDISLPKYSAIYKKKRKLKNFRGTKIPKYEIEFLLDLEKLGDKQFLIDSNYLDYEIQNNGIYSLKINGWKQRMHLEVIPESIGNLKRLQELSITGTDIVTVPDSIGKLQYLADLNLSFNKIQTLPNTLQELIRLKRLLLHNNQILKFPLLSPSIQELWIYGNQIETIPESIERLKDLEILFIESNRLSQLPQTIGKLESLQNLNLSGNRLTTIPESIGHLSELVYMTLTNNEITKLPASIGKLHNLKAIYLEGNRIEEIQPELGRLKNLEILDIRDNPVSLYSDSIEYLNPLEHTKITLLNPEFKVNDFFSLKLEEGKTNIYVRHKLFLQCKFLMLTIPVEQVDFLDEISSIDEAENILDKSLEGGHRINDYEIPPEVEYWGHCSNMQVWYENNYDTRLLHRNLSFPLLRRLTDVGDPLARRVLKEEVAKRYLSNYEPVKEFLSETGYLDYLNIEELESIGATPVEISKVIRRKERPFLEISLESLNEEYKAIINNIRNMEEFDIRELYQVSCLFHSPSIYFADFSTQTHKILRFIIFPNTSEYELLIRNRLESYLRYIRHSPELPLNFKHNLLKKNRIFTALFDEVVFNYE